MRVLFTVNPEKTIFLSMVPLAWALRTAGHEVRFASQPRFTDLITQAGLTAVPVGRDSDPWRTLVLDPDLIDVARAGLPPPWNVAEDPSNADWDDLLFFHRDAVADTHKPQNFPIIADLVAFARHWKPDLVVWEPFTYAGAIAAKASGAAHARVLWGLDVFAATREIFKHFEARQPAEKRADPLAEWLASYGRRYGFEYTEDMALGQFTVEQLPISLSIHGDTHYVPMRYVPYGGPAVVPKWLWAEPERPRVALTVGTTAMDRLAGYGVDFQGIFDAVADLDIELVATIAESEQKKLTNVPDNTRVVPFVPLHALAPSCSAVIHHAGFGTLSTFSAHGVPQLALPCHFEGPLLSQLLVEQGAGLAVHSDVATGELVRENLLRLLREDGFRAHAASLRDEVRALPSPNELVPRIEELTAVHRPAPQ
ncbi:activator-dependent family glycosyltransferase [Actinosynnema sp. NPDC047251]|uniref:Glycosyltransferase, family 1 n=1 Tax=Saccharothrix espanaensis (strain ATCC 51144 / DSM 44229 / JCM 9112 / NBRC 15066 / NRRL 15764) TaxID=1179773 RepID=K0K8I6_SACES|nr:activator-dependent family glycosyltransferase [Saccharothrix espanaensis]CCH33129.1 Glycosyltransferase, family 1 [Saccharothrix espanaensis DSM 44229]